MKRLALLSVIAGLVCPAALAVQHRPLIISSQDHTLRDVRDCAHFHTTNTTTFPSRVFAREEHDLPAASDLLRVKAAEEGGVWVSGWDRPYARVTVCKYAVGLSDAQAARALGVIRVSVRPGEVSAEGPEITAEQVWWAHIIVRVPRRARVDVVSSNGGIAIRNMTGQVTAKATNGGISLAASSGQNRLSTENGGISLDGVSGRVEATTQNGPISLRVRGSTTLPEIDASTDDGGGIVCTLKVCDKGEWNPTRTRLRLGGGPGSIRLTTGDAPIQIEQVR